VGHFRDSAEGGRRGWETCRLTDMTAGGKGVVKEDKRLQNKTEQWFQPCDLYWEMSRD